jgi:hypothetical protein
MESMIYGRRWTWGEKLVPLVWSSVLAVAAGLAGWALLGLGPWFDHLGLPDGPPPVSDAVPSDQPTADISVQSDPRLAVLAAVLERVLGFRNLQLVFAFVVQSAVFIAPWVVAAFLVWPLLRWVLSGGRDTHGLFRRWLALIAAQWAAFVRALGEWWGSPRSEPPRPLGASAPREWLRSLFRRAPPKRLVPVLIEAFLRLAAWAEPLAVYRQGETTREFLDRVAAALPEAAPQLAAVRDGLERQLFGPGLTAAEQTAFLEDVASLVSRSAFHDSPPGVS